MSVYYLFEYGISIPIIKKIDELGIDIMDIVVLKDDALLPIFKRGSKKAKDVITAAEKFHNNGKKENIYILLKYGLSKEVCDTLFSNGIKPSNLKELTQKDLEQKYQLSKVIVSRIYHSFNYYMLSDSNTKEKSISKDYSLKLHLILKDVFDVGVSYSLQDLKEILMNYDYPIDYLDEDIKRLQERGFVIYTENGMELSYPRLKEYLSGLKSNRKTIICKRLSGLTLEEIGKEEGVTRERIRQIVSKEVSIMPTLNEDKYRKIFEFYDWNCNDFTEFFNEDEMVYFYLNERYKKGDKDISELFDEDITTKQRDYLQKKYNIENLLGEETYITRTDVLKLIVKKYARDTIKISKLCQIYNNFINNHLKEYNLHPFDDRTMENTLDRLDNTVLGYKRSVRYYDYSEIHEDIEILKELLNLSEGFYSTKVLFDRNIDLMSELEIKDEYELHYILRKLFSNTNCNVSFSRMPNFIVGNVEKDEFLLKKLEELSPIHFDDYIEYLEEEYGHKKNTMNTYIGVKFGAFFSNGYFDKNNKKMNELEISIFKEIFTKEVYSINEAKTILNNYGLSEQYFTNYNMTLIGYKIKSNYMIKNNYSSVYELLLDLIEKKDFITFNKDYASVSTFYFTLNRLEKSFDIIKLNNDKYVTFKKLFSMGVTKELLNNVRDEILKELEIKKYITIQHIKKTTDKTILNNYNFNDVFYESLITPLDGVRKTRLYGYKIFTVNLKSASRVGFICHVINLYGSISINELQKNLKLDYGIDLPSSKIKEYVKMTKLYYNDDLDKVYVDKNEYYNDFYMEVSDNKK